MVETKGQTDSHARSAAIRALNDRLRRTGAGGAVVMTRGIASLDPETTFAILAAVSAFDRFDEDNDPWGEHDCASLTVQGHRVIWKIDYFDPTRTWLSSNPADPAVTARVLTIMLADEY